MKKYLVRFEPWFNRVKYFLLGALVTGLVSPLVLYGLFWLSYRGRILPNIRVGEVLVSGLTRNQAMELLNQRVETYTQGVWPATFEMDAAVWEVTPPAQVVSYDVAGTVDELFMEGRTGSLFTQFKSQWFLATNGAEIPMKMSLDPQWINDLTATFSASLHTPSVAPSLEVKGKKVVAHAGEAGQEFDIEQFSGQLNQALANLQPLPRTLPVVEVGVQATPDQLETTRLRAEMLLPRQLEIKLNGEKADTEVWRLGGEELLPFLAFDGGFNRAAVERYVKTVAETVNRPAQDAKLEFDSTTSRVVEFAAAKDGLEVDNAETAERLMRALKMLEQTETVEPVALMVTHTKPDITLADVNDLGLKELIGKGESTYFGSIASRVHNVALAASRINGTLVKPGEIFSFNAAIGEVSASTGYQSAYVIRNGRTELGDGGGVCQDSTTVFRAALDAGLPIVERRGHSYRVGYYEQNAKAGLDATVYSPTTDLKFLNDTPAHILVQVKADSANRHLTVEIYGTSDGRKATVTEPVVWDVTPPPPDVYQDDPTLPAGKLKQVDWKAWGAKSKFSYTVVRNGETIIDKTFLTVYKPWAAVYLRGTGGV